MSGAAVKLPLTGACLCGALRYEITEPPTMAYACHCTDCQRLTSSAFSMGIVVSDKALRLSGIEPRRLQRTADSGRVNTRLVCPQCGSWISGTPRDGVSARARGHARRYVLAAADAAHLDAQQAALDHIAGGRRGLREGPASLSNFRVLGG